MNKMYPSCAKVSMCGKSAGGSTETETPSHGVTDFHHSAQVTEAQTAKTKSIT